MLAASYFARRARRLRRFDVKGDIDFFDTKLGKKWKSGFENPMTNREAALILGVRENSKPEQIAAAHRKLMLLNHPDNGGSTYLLRR
jgi:hypothetical protein